MNLLRPHKLAQDEPNRGREQTKGYRAANSTSANPKHKKHLLKYKQQ
jgi:hypothetical protein